MSNANVFEEIGNELMLIVDREAEKLAAKIGRIVESKAKDVLKHDDVRTQIKHNMLEYLVNVTAETQVSASKKTAKPVKKLTENVKLKKVSESTLVNGQVKSKKVTESESSSAVKSAAASVARKGRGAIKFLEIGVRQAMPEIERLSIEI